jgi:phage terminase small subunit
MHLLLLESFLRVCEMSIPAPSHPATWATHPALTPRQLCPFKLTYTNVQRVDSFVLRYHCRAWDIQSTAVHQAASHGFALQGSFGPGNAVG